jgi:bifunctional non-homologous end joining protein LigD
VLKRTAFIVPSLPVLKQRPPQGPNWIHEVKFDGWRAQLHKDGDEVTIFSRNGRDFTRRFRTIRDSLIALPVTSAIIDAELVAGDTDGKPDFTALMQGSYGNICAWCFDLMALNWRDLTQRPLLERKGRLSNLLCKRDDETLRYSDEFPDAERLLAAGNDMQLEGVVSKRVDQPYRSGINPRWIKVKTAAWCEANRGRWEMFEKSR